MKCRGCGYSDSPRKKKPVIYNVVITGEEAALMHGIENRFGEIIDGNGNPLFMSVVETVVESYAGCSCLSIGDDGRARLVKPEVTMCRVCNERGLCSFGEDGQG